MLELEELTTLPLRRHSNGHDLENKQMHQSMPGCADLFEDDKLFNRSIAMPIAKYLQSQKIRFQIRTIDRITAWSSDAADPDPLAAMLTDRWKQLAELHALITSPVAQTERELAAFLVKTPYVLLLSVTGINVVSASELAGEAGPIEHDASATALNGRAGLHPSRYQSDEVDRSDHVAKASTESPCFSNFVSFIAIII